MPHPALPARPARRAAWLAAFGAAAALAAPARAQLVTTLVDRDGVTIPCVTAGLLAPVAQEYCVRRSLKQGWLMKSELGRSGLTLGEGAAVTAVAPGSPAAAAGVQPGDRLLAVDGRPVRPPPGETARRMLFGPAGETVRLTLARSGRPEDVGVKRAAAPEPADAPRGPNPLVGVHPLMNWRGDYVPCMGAGPLGPAAVAMCTSKMQKVGFVKTTALGDTGLVFDEARADAAAVSTVAPGSPAAAAGVRPGDVVTAVDGRPLAADEAREAQALLFGKAGDTRRLTLQRAGRTVMVDLRLDAAR